MFIEALTPDVRYERAIDIYVRELGIPDPLASVIATRALVALGYSDKEASAAVRLLPEGSGVAEGIRAALKSLARP